MRSLDLAVIGLYALAMLAIGYYKLRVQTADDYAERLPDWEMAQANGLK